MTAAAGRRHRWERDPHLDAAIQSHDIRSV